MTDSRVGMNKHTLVTLALYGQQERAENLYRQVKRTMKRLRMRVGKAEPFTVAPPGTGSEPNIHDVVRWLDSLNKTRKYTKERAFVRRLRVTLDSRVRPEVLTEDDSPKGLH